MKTSFWRGKDPALAAALAAKDATVTVAWRGLEMFVSAAGSRIVGFAIDPATGEVRPFVDGAVDDLEALVRALDRWSAARLAEA
jgi:hypothetical protein